MIMKKKMVTCPVCRKKFKSKRKDQIYCSADCRIGNWFKKHPRVNLDKLPKEIVRKIKHALER